MKTNLCIILCVFCLTNVFSQSEMGINTETMSPSAVFEVVSSDKGVLIPRLSATQRMAIAAPDTGLMVYDSTFQFFYYFDGSSWLQLRAGLISELSDADNDTKIQVEESADEDTIRFDIGGTEYFKMSNGRLEVLNTGNSVFIGEGAGANDNLDDKENTFVGFNAGNSNTTGWFNTANGSNSLRFNTTGARNTAIGKDALYSNTIGFGNTANGNRALYFNTTGDYNTANSYDALRFNTTGYENTANGYEALYLNTTGYYNTANGNGALRSNTTGYENTANGYEAGFNALGNGNVFLGNKAGYNFTDSNQLFIDNSNTNTPLIWGDFANDSLKVHGTFNINDAFSFPTADGTNGNTLLTDGAGQLSWGSPAIAIISDADSDTQIQVEETADEDIIRFDLGGIEKWTMLGNRLESTNTGLSTFIGGGSGNLDDGSNNLNVAVGDSTLYNNTIGQYNSALGYKALYSNIDGSRNVGVGLQALFSNTSGFANVSVGFRSLSSNTTGSLNSALGYSALRDNVTGERNSASGGNSLLNNVSGSYNTANGFGSLSSNIVGSGNTAMGHLAQYHNDSGSYNTAIGDQALFNTPVDSMNSALGYQAGYNSMGSGNLLLGYQAGYNETGSNRLYIENSKNDSTGALIYGEFDNDFIRINGKLIAAMGLNDADMDTKIQLEETADEDVIRFDLAGTEKWIMEDSRLEPTNNGFSVFIGQDAGLNDDLSDNQNVNVGNSAGKSNITGSSNAAVGAHAFKNNNGGTRNAAFGSSALKNATSGDSNTALGAFTLNAAGVGSNNTAVGKSAGFSNTGSGNVFLGHNTGFNNTGSNNLFLGSEAGFNELGGDLLYIENSASTTPLIWGDFANDSVKVHGTFNINDAFSFPTADGTNGNTLLTDGAGQLSWGSPAIAIISDADSDTQIQVEETADEDIIRFDLGGTEKWVMEGSRLEPNNSGFSVFIGDDAGLNDDLTDNENVNIGYKAGESNVTGNLNTTVGSRAMRDINGGTRNVALGYLALGKATTGSENTALGAFTLNASGVGSNNTAVGKEAGFNNTGSNNVFVGFSAGSDELGSNKLYIENSASTTPLIWGDFFNDLVGINRVATTNTLEVGGTASKAITGSWLANSDKRLKKNISYLDSEKILQKVLQMKGVNYEWNDDKTGMKRPEGIMYGFIAQDLEKVWPTKVKEDSQGYLQTAYGDYDPMFVEAIKALYAQNQELMQKMEVQNIKNESLKAEVVELSAMKDQISALSKRLEMIEEVKALGYND